MAIRGGDAAILTSNTPLNTTTNTLLVTLGPIDVPADSTRVIIAGLCCILTGAGATALAIQVRRGALITDPLVGVSLADPGAASTNCQVNLMVIDTLVNAATATYSLCCAQVAATGNGQNVQSALFVLFI
jgi:hypothetical protein